MVRGIRVLPNSLINHHNKGIRVFELAYHTVFSMLAYRRLSQQRNQGFLSSYQSEGIIRVSKLAYQVITAKEFRVFRPRLSAIATKEFRVSELAYQVITAGFPSSLISYQQERNHLVAMEMCSSLGFASTLPAVASIGKETLGKPRPQQKPAAPCTTATQQQQQKQKRTLVKPRSQLKTPGSCRIATQQAEQRQLPLQQELDAPHTAGPASHPSRRGVLGLIGSLSLGALFHDSSSAEASTAPSCDFTIAPSGLAFCDTSVGTGLSASKGMAIKANYVGKLEDGKVFDSSYDRGKPFTFIVGVGQVIKGWDEGILGGEGIPPMLAGGKRTLRIPSSLGYGERGAGCRGGSCLIPPNSVLLFDVEFIGKAY